MREAIRPCPGAGTLGGRSERFQVGGLCGSQAAVGYPQGRGGRVGYVRAVTFG